jgi:hypothetical protein
MWTNYLDLSHLVRQLCMVWCQKITEDPECLDNTWMSRYPDMVADIVELTLEWLDQGSAIEMAIAALDTKGIEEF